MLPDPPRLIPELDVSDLAESTRLYIDFFGFELLFERPEEGFAYLNCEGSHLMFQQVEGPGRRFRTAPLEAPFGRGINLQIQVADVDASHARAVKAGYPLLIPLEERWYVQGRRERGNRQFVVADRDGYLLRFYTDLGMRSMP